ncbi:MAG TPA: NIPSNAP family protein, partial [Urbifossiella sp.]
MRLLASTITLAAIFTMTTTSTADDKKPDTRVYEMRIYHANPGKLDDLNARFKNHTMKFFEKHGITNVGYFVPVGANPDEKLVYFISYPSKDAADKSWKAFINDEGWKKAAAESEKNGKLVKKVDRKFLHATDYSPPLKIETKGDRVFELRTYTATKGALGPLDDRFKDHTM